MTRRGRRSKDAIERRRAKTIPMPPPISYLRAKTKLPQWIEETYPIESKRLSYGVDWERQRQRALERDEYICQFDGCNVTDKLHVHHIKPFRISEDNSLENLITLCPKHHKIVEQKR